MPEELSRGSPGVAPLASKDYGPVGLSIHWSLWLQGPWAITQFPLHLRSILHPPRCVCPTICPPMLLQPLSRRLAWPALRTPGVSAVLGAQLDLHTN